MGEAFLYLIAYRLRAERHTEISFIQGHLSNPKASEHDRKHRGEEVPVLDLALVHHDGATEEEERDRSRTVVRMLHCLVSSATSLPTLLPQGVLFGEPIRFKHRTIHCSIFCPFFFSLYQLFCLIFETFPAGKRTDPM